MASIIWYHGGPKLSDLKHLRWDRERNKQDQNAEGPGLYWTTDLQEAKRYGSYLYHGTTRPGFRVLPQTKPTLAFAKQVFRVSSKQRQNDFLQEWDDQPLDKVLASYTHHDTMIDAAVLLYHDLFRYNADEYVHAMSTLYDGAVISFKKTAFSGPRKHLVCWSPEKMTIQETP